MCAGYGVPRDRGSAGRGSRGSGGYDGRRRASPSASPTARTTGRAPRANASMRSGAARIERPVLVLTERRSARPSSARRAAVVSAPYVRARAAATLDDAADETSCRRLPSGGRRLRGRTRARSSRGTSTTPRRRPRRRRCAGCRRRRVAAKQLTASTMSDCPHRSRREHVLRSRARSRLGEDREVGDTQMTKLVVTGAFAPQCSLSRCAKKPFCERNRWRIGRGGHLDEVAGQDRGPLRVDGEHHAAQSARGGGSGVAGSRGGGWSGACAQSGQVIAFAPADDGPTAAML